jgi:hypothetical protein
MDLLMVWLTPLVSPLPHPLHDPHNFSTRRLPPRPLHLHMWRVSEA